MRQREILNAAKEQAGMTQKEFAKYFGILPEKTAQIHPKRLACRLAG